MLYTKQSDMFEENLMHEILNQAKHIWVQEWLELRKDEGTCTLGDHIATPYGKIRAPNQMQGNVAKWKTAQLVLKFLADNNINAKYYEGRMD